MKIVKTDLTTRQYRLLDYLNERPEGATKEQIAFDLATWYPRCLETCKPENSSAFRKIRRDINALQNSEITQGVYACIHGRYKRLTEPEFEHFIAKEKEKINRLGQKIKSIIEKTNLDGQTRLWNDTVECWKIENPEFEKFKRIMNQLKTECGWPDE